MEGTGEFWFDCTWFCKVLLRTREGGCILGDQHPLSRMHRSGGRNCLKKICFTCTSLQNLVLILLLCPFILMFSFARIIIKKYLSIVNIDCGIIDFQYILCLFEIMFLL